MSLTTLSGAGTPLHDSRRPEPPWAGYWWATGAVVAATAIFILASRQLNLSHDVELLYLPIVLACAQRFGTGPASLAAIGSVLCWDFFFITPLYSLHVGSTRDILLLTVFLVVSAITGRLADRVQRKTREAAILEERNRMSREIHDTLAQGLTGIVIQLQAAERVVFTEDDTERSAVHQALLLAEQCLDEARRSVKAIRPRPLEQRTLPEALKILLEQMTHNLPIRTALRVEGSPYVLPELVEVNLLRIGQEALTNALRHAKPRKVDMTVTFAPAAISLRIQDDGDGYDADRVREGRDCFGLAGMQERADQMRGTLILDSRPTLGTMVEVSAPTSSRDAAR